jgi:hypothetical protein
MRRPALLAVLLCGCLKASVVIVDRKTSLEQQAAGSYPTLTRESEEAGVQPSPAPLTRDQLAKNAPLAAPTEGSDDDATDGTDALLVRRCLGEALDGRLAFTHDTCQGDPDEQALSHLTERTNRQRAQTWAYLATLQPNAKPEAVRAAWRALRLRELVCGGQLQTADKKWEIKKC